MPTLRLRFPGGRYHATPWGHHVNEGLIEWPPSPWRLLRALLACGFSSQEWTEIPPLARQLINKLAGVLPSYRLPEVSAAHSRHYMPYIEGKTQKTTLVFDTWANIGTSELLIHWPCELTDEESALLDQLTSALGYLGRSESWVEAELVGAATSEWNAEPCRDGEHRGRGWEQVSLMAAIPSDEYLAWHKQTTATIHEAIKLPESTRKPTAKQLEKQRKAVEQQRVKAVAPYPPDLLACMTKDTAWWKGHGWSQPPGSRRMLYWRRSDAIQVGAPQRPKPPHYNTVTTMLLSLTTPSGNPSALPPITRTLPQAELFHRAIVGRLGQGYQVCCPELTGKDEHGRPLRCQHEHAHILPVDLDGDGRLDHIIVYAKMGLRDAAQRAIRTLRRTWTKGGVGDLQVAVAGSGDLEILRQLPFPFNRRIEGLLGPEEGCRVWQSTTPIVFPRYLKARGKNSLIGQINAELSSRGLPAVAHVDRLPIDVETLEFRHFVRCRQRGGVSPPVDAGYALRLQFAESVSGPLAIGYASHFGLGLFGARP